MLNFVRVVTFLGFPGGSEVKDSACNAGDLGSIPGLGRSPGEGKGYPFQYSGLENSTDCLVYGVAKSQTRLSDFHFHFLVIIINATMNICVQGFIWTQFFFLTGIYLGVELLSHYGLPS